MPKESLHLDLLSLARVKRAESDLVAPAAVADGGPLEVGEASVSVHELHESGQIDPAVRLGRQEQVSRLELRVAVKEGVKEIDSILRGGEVRIDAFVLAFFAV